MQKDGFRYGAALGAAALFVLWLAGPWFALPLVVFALFCLYFFRDPERHPPSELVPVAVSPADGRVVEIREVEHEGAPFRRISIFLNVFDVHVNRAPIAGVIRDVHYYPGRFLIASKPEASTENERNTVTIEGPDGVMVFKQIAGIIARRIVFWKKAGDAVAIGERVGLIKFGSRVDVFVAPGWDIAVRVGDHVRGGASILARRNGHGG